MPFPQPRYALFVKLLARRDHAERRRICIARKLARNNVTRSTDVTGELLTRRASAENPDVLWAISASAAKAAIRIGRRIVIGVISGSPALTMNVVLKLMDNEFLF